MKITSLTLVGLFILSACAHVDSPVSPSITVESPTATKNVVTPTPLASSTPLPSRTPIPSPIPFVASTEWIKDYPTKEALVIYGTSWRNQYTINFMNWGDFYLEPYLVLYEDGQLIFGTGAYEKQLSQNETKEIVTKLEELGFFQLPNTYAVDKENPLYNFQNKVVPDANLNLPSVVVTVNGQEIRYMKEWEKYLIPPMKNIISYLKSISSDGAIRYQPDRLLVVARDIEQIPEGNTVAPWPEDMPSPISISYLEGREALKLYEAVGENQLFSYEGKNYEVYLRPILPHECHTYHYSDTIFPPQTQPSFTCDGW